jgi:hypothetical protein
VVALKKIKQCSFFTQAGGEVREPDDRLERLLRQQPAVARLRLHRQHEEAGPAGESDAVEHDAADGQRVLHADQEPGKKLHFLAKSCIFWQKVVFGEKNCKKLQKF